MHNWIDDGISSQSKLWRQWWLGARYSHLNRMTGWFLIVCFYIMYVDDCLLSESLSQASCQLEYSSYVSQNSMYLSLTIYMITSFARQEKQDQVQHQSTTSTCRGDTRRSSGEPVWYFKAITLAAMGFTIYCYCSDGILLSRDSNFS